MPSGRGVKKWRPPPSNSIKINSDAAFNQSKGKGAVGIIARDHGGTCLTAVAKTYAASSPLVAEAIGLREAMILASNLSIPEVIFESDNLILIEACRGNQKKEEIRSILTDIQVLRRGFQRCGFTWTCREGNEAAHCIAKMAEQNNLQGNWSSNPPSLLQQVLLKDRSGLLIEG